MKKINLFISALMICLAVLVAGAAIVVPTLQFQAQALAVRTASNANGELSGIDLFDSEGRYAVGREDLTRGAVFNFFGHDWYVVKVNGDVATFWMTDPYARTLFDKTARSGDGIFKDGSNIWANGYTQTIWSSASNDNKDVKLSQSLIREFLNGQASEMIDNEAYAKYQKNVVSGSVDGTNEVNASCQKPIQKLAYSDSSLNNVTEYKEPTNELTAYYDLNEDDRLWLPSVYEIRTMWELPETMLGWTDTTVSGTDTGSYAWLRTPDVDNSYKATCLNYKKLTEEAGYFASRPIKQEAGVRPAIHMNIENIEAEYQAHLAATKNNGNKGGWFDDDWLKALFIVVCILGLVGVALVIIAVILKARKQRAEEQQA